MLKVAGGGISGSLNYQGTWDASTNSPTLTSGVGVKGYYYVVSVAGTTNLDGITDWQIGDWAVFNGTVWQKVDNSEAVVSVNGQTGAVVLTAPDVGATPNTAFVLAGTGLSGGGQLTGNVTVNLANTAVSAGTYGSNVAVPQIVIDAQGRITSAANVTIDTGPNGTVTQIDTGTGLTGGPVTTTGTISLANTAVTLGSYGDAANVATFTVNQQGQLTAAGNVAINIAVANVAGAVPNTVNVLADGLLTGGGALTGNVTVSLTNVPIANVTGGVANTVSVLAGTGLSGGGNLSSNVTLALANTAVAAGNYGTAASVGQFTVDAQGRLTSAANVAIDIAVANVSGAVVNTTTITAGTGLTGGGNLSSNVTLNLANTAVAAGSYGTASSVSQFTVDAQGRLTTAANVAISIAVANVSGAVENTTTIIAGTGLSGGGNLASNVTINLANTTANAGTYGSATQVPQIAVDAQGRITAVANVSITGGGGTGNVVSNVVTITSGTAIGWSNVTSAILSWTNATSAIITWQNTTYNVTNNNATMLVNYPSDAFTVLLPSASTVLGQQYRIKKIDNSSNVVTVSTTSSQTIDGNLTYSLATIYKSVTVQSDGSNYFIFATT